jgi:hypothetical protein
MEKHCFMKKLTLLLLVISYCYSAKSQFKYTAKIETSYQLFLGSPIKYDAGPGWRGYQLDKMQNGLEIGVVNGVSFNDNYRLGIGTSYLNYEGINGYSIYGDLEILTSKGKTPPVFHLKVGRSHINNQYENGNTGNFFEVGGGIERKISRIVSLQFKIGFRFAHDSILFPISIGTRF